MKRIFILILFFVFCFYAKSQTALINSYRFSVSIPALTKYIKINFSDSTQSTADSRGFIYGPSNDQWNNRTIKTTDRAAYSQHLIYNDGTGSGVQIAMRLYSNLTSSWLNTYSVNAIPWPSTGTSNTTGFPDSCFRISASNNNNSAVAIMFSGMNDSKTYTARILVSRKTTGTFPCTFVYGAQSVTVPNVNGNETQAVVLTGITSSGGAAIIQETTTGSFTFMAAIILEEN